MTGYSLKCSSKMRAVERTPSQKPPDAGAYGGLASRRLRGPGGRAVPGGRGGCGRQRQHLGEKKQGLHARVLWFIPQVDVTQEVTLPAKAPVHSGKERRFSSSVPYPSGPVFFSFSSHKHSFAHDSHTKDGALAVTGSGLRPPSSPPDPSSMQKRPENI